MINCHKCNFENLEDSPTCIHCGTQLQTYNNSDLMERENKAAIDDFTATYNDAGGKLQFTEDSINPNHYTSFAIAPNEYITANELGWEVGNVIKYVSRYKLKNGLEDLRKAQKYLELLIDREYCES